MSESNVEKAAEVAHPCPDCGPDVGAPVWHDDGVQVVFTCVACGVEWVA